MRKVTLHIDPDDFAFAKRLAKQDGYAGPADCLTGILNTAITQWRDQLETPPHLRARIDELEAANDRQLLMIGVLRDLMCQALRECARLANENDAMRSGTRAAAAGDEIDDGIPF